jgi:hypothetical protein
VIQWTVCAVKRCTCNRYRKNASVSSGELCSEHKKAMKGTAKLLDVKAGALVRNEVRDRVKRSLSPALFSDDANMRLQHLRYT